MVGSRFENLRVAWYKIDVELDHELAQKLDTFAAVRKEFENNKDFRKMANDPFKPGNLPKKVEAHEVVHCSIVKEVSPKNCPGITRAGEREHVLIIPEFGKVFLAEALLQHGRKTLTMLRIELGSPQAGGLLLAQGGSNGNPPHG